MKEFGGNKFVNRNGNDKPNYKKSFRSNVTDKFQLRKKKNREVKKKEFRQKKKRVDHIMRGSHVPTANNLNAEATSRKSRKRKSR